MVWYRILETFFVIYGHFGPVNTMYEKLTFILEFCDPENPYFDVWYVDVEKYWKKVWNFGNSSFLAFFVTFSHLYAIYGILSIDFGFYSPKNPYFDV